MHEIVYCQMCGEYIPEAGNSLRQYCEPCKKTRKQMHEKKKNETTKSYCIKCGKKTETYSSKVCKSCKSKILKEINKNKRMGKTVFFCYDCGQFVNEKTKKGRCNDCTQKRILQKEEKENKYAPKMRMPDFIKNLRKSAQEKNQIFQEYLVNGNVAAREMIQLGVKRYRNKYFNNKNKLISGD